MSDTTKKYKFKPGTFILVPNRQHLFDLEDTTIRVYLAICQFADSQGCCTPSIRGLYEMAKCSEMTIMRHTKILEKKGLISVVREKESSTKNKVNRYFILDKGPLQPESTPPSEEIEGSLQPEGTVPSGQTVGVPSGESPIPNPSSSTNPSITNPSDSSTKNGVTASDGLGDIVSLSSFDEKPISQPSVKTYGDPDINKVIKAFTAQIGHMTKIAFQRREANILIRQYGLDRVLGAINTVAEYRGVKFFPSVKNIADLREKWVALENFALRESSPSSSKMGVL